MAWRNLAHFYALHPLSLGGRMRFCASPSGGQATLQEVHVQLFDFYLTSVSVVNPPAFHRLCLLLQSQQKSPFASTGWQTCVFRLCFSRTLRGWLSVVTSCSVNSTRLRHRTWQLPHLSHCWLCLPVGLHHPEFGKNRITVLWIRSATMMTGFRLNLSPLKEPLGFVKLVEWVRYMHVHG